METNGGYNVAGVNSRCAEGILVFRSNKGLFDLIPTAMSICVQDVEKAFADINLEYYEQNPSTIPPDYIPSIITAVDKIHCRFSRSMYCFVLRG